MLRKIILLEFLVLFNIQNSLGQSFLLFGQDISNRAIKTTAPFLNIPPDARSAGMGDVGVATSADANAMYWNPAKLVFLEKKAGVSFSNTPWMHDLTKETSLSYLSTYCKIDKLNAVGFDLRYFNMGNFDFVNNAGFVTNMNRPREFSISFTYSRKLSNYLSVAVSGRYIHSNLSADLLYSNQLESVTGNAGAVDLSVFYTRTVNAQTTPVDLAFGVNISNLGSKMAYSNSKNTKEFLPANLRIGTAITTHIDFFNKITVAADLNKLLVPTPPLVDNQGNIIYGIDPKDITVLQGVVSSFGDAPGGLQEELQEVMYSLGLEYWYNDIIAARVGYTGEHINKGNRNYFTLGVGTRYDFFGFDVAYIFSQNPNNPLAETLRLTFSFNFKDKNPKSKSTDAIEVEEEVLEEE